MEALSGQTACRFHPATVGANALDTLPNVDKARRNARMGLRGVEPLTSRIRRAFAVGAGTADYTLPKGATAIRRFAADPDVVLSRKNASPAKEGCRVRPRLRSFLNAPVKRGRSIVQRALRGLRLAGWAGFPSSSFANRSSIESADTTPRPERAACIAGRVAAFGARTSKGSARRWMIWR